ncbi:fumarylacetoacetate hydrolase family protein [Polymorphospora rubra]|uniref:2-keto-4-pentenoate hydratase n=1 Tax=Polymorphospora rubra TaxID=338584 RepID=UPI0033E43BAA
MTDLATIAERLDRAATSRTATPQFGSDAGLDVPTAYRIQEAVVAHRLARGERPVGLKLGLTSRAKMAQMGVDEVIWGRLTDAMHIPDGGTISLADHIHPKAEPEVAFLVEGGAIAAVAPAIEVIDSRYVDFRFTLPEVIADNTSASGFVVGAWQPVPAGIDNLGVLLEVDGRTVQIGSTAAILGDPRRALAEAVRLAAASGIELTDGSVLLAGAATAAVPLKPGAHVRAVVESLGTASLKVTP